MIISRHEKTHNITIEGTKLEQVNIFKYVGAILGSNGKIDEEINHRTGATGRLYNQIKTTFLGKNKYQK